MNYAIFGHFSPHSHCQFVTRLFSDDPTLALNIQAEEVRLEQQDYRRIVQAPGGRD